MRISAKANIYHSKGIDKSYPKMYFLLNLSHYVKSYGHLYQILAFLTMPAFQIWPCHVTQKQISKKIYLFLILHLILDKAAKFLVEKLSTSEVISQKPHGGGWKKPPSSAFRVNRETPIYPPFAISLMHFSDKSKSYHVND